MVQGEVEMVMATAMMKVIEKEEEVEIVRARMMKVVKEEMVFGEEEVERVMASMMMKVVMMKVVEE